MNSSGPETPAAESLRLVQEFPNNPEQSGKTLAQLGRENGYDVIYPAVNMLWDSCVKQKEREIIAFLRQSEWQWRRWAQDPDILIAGLPQADGGFVPVGFYATGDKEDGSFATLDLEGSGEELDYLQGAVPDPRPKLRPLVYCKGRKYYFILAGRVQELLRAGYDRAQVFLTQGKGYLDKHEAYVIRRGPYDVQKAREDKVKHYITPHKA